MSVGEQMIPLFDILDHPPANVGENASAITPDLAITDDPNTREPNKSGIPEATEPHRPTRQSDISGITKPRRSNRVPKPSQAGLHSTEYQQREEIGIKENQDWATDHPNASSTISYPPED